MNMTLDNEEIKSAIALYVAYQYRIRPEWLQWNIELSNNKLTSLSVTVGTDNNDD